MGKATKKIATKKVAAKKSAKKRPKSGRGSGKKLTATQMRCRHEGCKRRSRGSRFQFFCDKHPPAKGVGFGKVLSFDATRAKKSVKATQKIARRLAAKRRAA